METVTRHEASSTTSEDGESKSKWLADAKRFNAQKLRIRMKEQKLRFQNTPDDKENNGANLHRPSSRPGLAIAVSMSEDAGEPTTKTTTTTVATPRESPFVNIQAMMEGESLDFGNASAWAMMEHYDMGSKMSTPSRLSESPIIKDASTFWDDKSFTTTEQRSLPFSPDARSIGTPSTITRTTYTPKFVVPHHIVEEDDEDEDHILLQGKSTNEEEPWKSAEQSTNDGNTDHPSSSPTPAKLQRQWIREKENDYHSRSPQVSLLQDSLILSESAAHDNTTIRTVPSIASEDDDNTTYASKVTGLSTAPTAVVSQFNEIRYPQLRKPSALIIQTREDNHETSDRLRLKERVQELEQALRATIATPRGTTLQENPIKTLLDRNQTLVKEVRFADSTCVELSGRVTGLENEKKILKERISSLEDENKDLRRDLSHMMIESASLARTSLDDRLSVTSVVRICQEEEGIIRGAVEELKAEVAAWAKEQTTPLASSTSTLLSDIDMNLSCNEMDAPQTLAKALHVQVELVKEQKQLSREAQDLKSELVTLRARNAVLEDQLQQERSKTDAAGNSSLLLDLSRAEEESNFLGRQLGNVQDKLDTARQELDDERKKSISIDSKWRTETALQLQTIRSLEAKLETASQSLASTVHTYGSLQSRRDWDTQVTTVEQDILHAKSTLIAFKRELESLLSQDTYDSKPLATTDGNTHVVSLVAKFVERMRKQFASLNFQVDKAITQYNDRLEQLTVTVAFLRSSLLFETSSVSTAAAPAHQHHSHDVTSLSSSRSKSDEALEDDNEDGDDEDDMYSRMEEARVSFPVHTLHTDDMSTDLDDLSRLLSDDSTLESILKSGAAERSLLEFENLRKPMESAIRECQRVRERSIALKQELQSEKIAFTQLESENRRLLREYSQKEEERQLVRGALDEAKAKIELLESLLSDQKTQNGEQRISFDNKCEKLEIERVRLENWLKDTTTSKEEAVKRVVGLQADLEDARDELRTTQNTLADTEEALTDLKTQLGEMEGRAYKAEDLVIETRISQEDMRKERALLKAQIAKLESQTQILEENLDRVTKTAQKQFGEMSTTIDAIHTQKEEHVEVIRRFVTVYHSICDLLYRYENMKTSPRDDEGDSRLGINWSLLEQIAPFISSTLEDSAAKEAQLDSLRGDLQGVQNDLLRSSDLGTQYKAKIEEEKTQNQKLFGLLQQAELEMERSASQIRELSDALTKQHQQETEMLSKTKVAEQERDSVRSDLSDLQREISVERRQNRQKVNEMAHELSATRKTEEDLKNTIDSLESKGTRLRQYVKKLTIKCEEWEMSYERQTKSLEKSQLRNARMKEKVLDMAVKFKDLSGRVKSKNKAQLENREKWAGERLDLQQIHAKLEKELETITKELSAIEQK